jgi:hypothetical protein
MLGTHTRRHGAVVRDDLKRCFCWFPRLRERAGHQ